VAGMPVTMSAAETQFYLHELGLSPKDRAIFLAQLSGRTDVSNAHLKYLIGATDSNRRESSSSERTQLFEARLTLIIAYLEHNPGETEQPLSPRGNHERHVRRYHYTRPYGGGVPLGGSARGPRAVVALLKAQHKNRGNNLEKNPPLYYGTLECPDLPRNAKVFAERKTSQACF
jgi:hypothetical protein